MELEVKNFYRVGLRSTRGKEEVKGKRVVLYIPSTNSLYISRGSSAFFAETNDSHATNMVTMVTDDGFGRSFRVRKDGSGYYFERGGYVSLFVDSGLDRSAIERTVADALTIAENLSKISELQRKEKALLAKLEEVREELQTAKQTAKQKED